LVEFTLRHALRQQHTIAVPVRVDGFGYWSGIDTQIEFRPAPVDTGIVFVRSDCDPPVRISGDVQRRVEVPRRTNLAEGDVDVQMVEHVMASLSGLRIDNCEIWVTAPEMPACDGSSKLFVDALMKAGRLPQPAFRPTLVVTGTVRVGDELSWVEAHPHPDGGLHLEYRLDFGPDSPIGVQRIELTLTPELFRYELAPARTFILKHEADWLREQGLGERVTCQDLLVFGNQGLIDNTLRYPDECVRHKTLDLIGDLALAGCDIQGRIVASRSGHRLNADLLRSMMAVEQVVGDCTDAA